MQKASPMFYSINALRFVAALAVVIHHSLTAFGAPLTRVQVGSAGVDVFFVISGFVIGIAGRREKPVDFIAHRFIRIFPVYWISTVVYMIYRYFEFGEAFNTSHFLHSIVLVPDFSVPNWGPIYYPAWTLCFEMTFYVVYGMVLAIASRHVNLFVAAVFATMAAIHIPVPFVHGGIFRTDLCIEFVAGLLLAEIIARGATVPRAVGNLAFVLATVGFVMNPLDPTWTRAVGWGVPSLLLAVGMLSLEGQRWLRSRIVVLSGSCSYALYLFQVPAMEGVVRASSSFSFYLDHHVIVRELILIPVAIAAGVSMHIFVEKPMTRFLRGLWARHERPLPKARTS